MCPTWDWSSQTWQQNSFSIKEKAGDFNFIRVENLLWGIGFQDGVNRCSVLGSWVTDSSFIPKLITEHFCLQQKWHSYHALLRPILHLSHQSGPDGGLGACSWERWLAPCGVQFLGHTGLWLLGSTFPPPAISPKSIWFFCLFSYICLGLMFWLFYDTRFHYVV